MESNKYFSKSITNVVYNKSPVIPDLLSAECVSRWKAFHAGCAGRTPSAEAGHPIWASPTSLALKLGLKVIRFCLPFVGAL